MDTEQALRFAVLGPVRAWRAEAELPLGGPQQRALLAVLLLNAGRAVPIGALVAAVWGDEPPARAVGTLRTYVSRLRQVMETDRSRPEVLLSVGDGYLLRVGGEDALDAARFEDRTAAAAATRDEPARARRLLGEALELWGGDDPLSGLPGPFAETQRARLAERRLAALETRLEVDLELGRHHEVIGELTVLAGDHPLRENSHGLLMLALYRCGRQAEALETYAAAHRLLAAELGIDPGPELQDLHQRVLANDPSLTVLPSPAAPETRPASLPADLADFTGRAPLVERLTGLLVADGPAPPVIALSGVGGVGKTALAVHLAHQVRDRYPGGQLYIDLQGCGEHPIPPSAVLAEFLRALGVPESAVPEGDGERASLYRSRLAGRRVLVLLDNASDVAQVRPLLPGDPGCAVLITARPKPAAVPGVQLVGLDVLGRSEAVELFTGIVGADRAAAEPAAVVEAVELVGFLPLAVRIAAARLAARPGWTIATLTARLADGRRRLAELRIGDLAVEATFQLGYDQLDHAQRRMFRLLAMPETGGLSLAAAAAASGTSEREAEDVLESLVDLGLLDSPAPGRYRYHDLLWLFARQLAERTDEAPERRAALTRLLGHLLGTQREALRLVRPGSLGAGGPSGEPVFASTGAARAWTLRELAGMLTVVRQVAEDPLGPLAEAADLLLAVGPVLEDGYRWAEVEPAARAVLEESRRRGDARAEARARHAFGCLLTHTSRLADAREQAERAAVLCRETGDRELLVEALDLLAHVAFYQRRYREAISNLERSRELGREFGDRVGEIERTAGIAYARVELGDAAGAVASAGDARDLARAAGHGAAEAYALYILGIALRELGRLDEAVARFDDGLAISWSQGLRARESYLLLRISETQLRRGRPREALASADKSLTIGREIGEEYQQGRALVALGHARTALDDSAGARRCWQDALELFVRLQVAEVDDVRRLLAGVRASPGP